MTIKNIPFCEELMPGEKVSNKQQCIENTITEVYIKYYKVIEE